MTFTFTQSTGGGVNLTANMDTIAKLKVYELAEKQTSLLQPLGHLLYWLN